MPAVPTPTATRRRAELMLALATFFWGWTFPVVKDALDALPVFAFLALRFALAALLMLPLAGRPRAPALKTGAYLGALLFFAFAFQTAALMLTSASKCAFITGLNVVWVALAAARTARVWCAVALAVASLWLLTAPDGGGVNLGDVLTLICSLFIAAHILALNRLPEKSASGELALLQFAVVAVLSLIVSLAFETPRWQNAARADALFALFLTAGGATVFAFWAQTHFQRHTTPVRAGLIFILEPVFAALFSVIWYGEILPATAWLGGGLIILSLWLSAAAPAHPPRHP